ncbi:hypothetical protein [Streptacidiphilus cavernicola]|uniref:SMI1/KNR4 family protein n=1 Tax=Streptacidiphilus cavernicola TaxID=3342716 RepID=A0ABV6W1R2_9ACTN
MDTGTLDRALRSGGVDPSDYLLPGSGGDVAPGQWAQDGGLALVAVGPTQWAVYGGADATFGSVTRLVTFDSVEQAYGEFLRELTRPDGAPFAEAKAAWQQQWEREQHDRDAKAARARPELAALREQWQRAWATRRARGEEAMTAAELHTAFQPLGRRLYWSLGGFDPSPVPDANVMAAPGPDGAWWLANTGERGRPPWFIAVGLTEAEACCYIFDATVAGSGFARRTTKTEWQAEIAARHRGGPLPPWPRVTA